MTRRLGAALAACVVAVALAACGSSSSPETVSVPHVAAAQTFRLAAFTPSGPIRAGRPTVISFHVQMPDGRPLTHYATGPGPHTGVHLIIVRDDLADIVHEHPPITADGTLRQRITLPAPGPYRVLVDIYPRVPGAGPNFQLFTTLHATGGPYRPIRLPPFRSEQVVHGYRFELLGPASGPNLHAIQAQFLHADVTDPQGRPVRFEPWFGALAHAIFFREGSLDYFHTHVCAPDAPNCGSLPGVPASRITGRATAPGKITIGVLLPLPGTWRLFLQCRQHGQILTAPFDLRVR
ncbi:MAG: hypothetical protein JOZ07_02695 [Solirubrobacterales bacterium]|nr:hypothetical protein [Solirubrobacterales bacterium]